MIVSFPLYFLLVPYAVVLLLFAFIAFFNVYNLVRYDATTGPTFLATFFFMAGGATVLFLTWQELKGVDWTMMVEFGTSLSASLPTIPL